VAVVFGGLWSLGALLPFWYLDSPEEGAAFFPSAGLALGILLMSPRQTWPLWLATVAVAEVTVDLTHGLSVPAALGFAAANTVEPFLGAAAMVWLAGVVAGSLRLSLAAYLSTGVMGGPLVGGMIGATTAVLFAGGSDWLATAGRWWLGDALGVLVVATPLVVWSSPSRHSPEVGRGELVAMVVSAVGVTLVPAVLWHHPMIYALLPILMWAALRGGTRAVSLTGLGVAFAADWAAVTGRAGELMATDGSGHQLVLVQVFLAVSLIAALVLAVEVTERRRAEAARREADAHRVAAELQALRSAEDERRRIARETHDIVGHALSVMLLSAGAARRVLDDDSGRSRAFLESIEAVGRTAFAELDVALALDVEPDAGPGLALLPDLVHGLRLAGMDVTLDMTGASGEVPGVVDRSAYRIVQEALTNVAKHSADQKAAVTVVFEPDAVSLFVSSEGSSVPNAPSGGRGLVGMEERARAVGGSLDVEADAQRFLVHAELPTHPPVSG
jgi:signal transduction histidine kinase